MDEIPDNYNDDEILSTYFADIRITTNEDKEEEELVEEEEEEMLYLQNTLDPNSPFSTTVTNVCTTVTTQTKQKVFRDGHIETEINILSPVVNAQTTLITDNQNPATLEETNSTKVFIIYIQICLCVFDD